MQRALALLLAVTLGLAGCLGAAPSDAPGAVEDSDAPGDAPQDVAPIEGDPLPSPVGHDHADPAQHEVEVNIEMLSYPMVDPLQTGYGEIDVQGDRLAQCAGTSVHLWNVSDRATPTLVATLPTEVECADVKLTDDAQFLIASGLQLWDIRDAAEPRVVATNEETGCHMCTIQTIGGKEILFSAANGVGMAISEIARDPPAITKIGEWGFGQSCSPLGGGDPTPWLGNLRAPDPDCLLIGQFHDVYVYDDPLLNKTIAVPAYWDLGMWFLDVSDPASPTVLGNWQDYQGESGDIHTTSVDFLEVDGEIRRIAVATSETGPIIGPFSTVEPSSVYVYDATDLDNIQLLARWVNPGKRSSGAQSEPNPYPVVGEFSTHNIQFEKGRIYLAHYHAGVWVLDVQAWLDAGGATSATTRPVGDPIPVLGVFNTRGMEGERRISMVWDVVLKDGYLYASDEVFGLYALRFVGDPLGDPAYTSDA